MSSLTLSNLSRLLCVAVVVTVSCCCCCFSFVIVDPQHDVVDVLVIAVTVSCCCCSSVIVDALKHDQHHRRSRADQSQ